MAQKILVVDDREPLRRRICSFLEQEGLKICGEAANGREGIEKVRELAPDLAILNISMPVMNGLEALPEILRCRPGIKVVIFTLDESEELKQHVFGLGAHSFVAKSAPPDELVAEVKRLLRQPASAG
jgi:two-component system chemotaxis response regulator CheY